MPAQISFLLYSLLSIIVFPFVAINFVIVNTGILPNVHSFVVTTGSMVPEIPKGSLVYTISQNDYKNGEVITFSDSLGKVTHRIKNSMFISGTKYFVTGGDANKANDTELISKQNIYGKIFAVIPNLGSTILFYKSSYGMIIGAVLPTLLLVFCLFNTRLVKFYSLKH